MFMLIVGLAGPSGSGKTTIGRILKESGDWEHIMLDNYFNPPSTFPVSYGYPNWERPQNLRFADLERNLRLLKVGRPARMTTVPEISGGVAYEVVMEPKGHVLVEGFMLFWESSIRELFDVKIYLDVPPVKMLERRALRFGQTTDYDAKVAVPEYLKYGIVQQNFADKILDGTKSVAEVYKDFKSYIEKSTRNKVQ